MTNFYTGSIVKIIAINVGVFSPPDSLRPRDHKLRKYLSLKLDFEYLKFYRTHCDNYLQI